ncbi:hypothetical protein SAMN05660299_02539 [Megasphaera paucivorans]|uniref:Uncharacterized protein n=1 Tax=Megasphaera paucivorans TaxID=349095 RepID=A0A1H0AK70_9FIRM|nr:hypothetical protein SAMN05660299_02539 [Megasphaera paucivorans]
MQLTRSQYVQLVIKKYLLDNMFFGSCIVMVRDNIIYLVDKNGSADVVSRAIFVYIREFFIGRGLKLSNRL